MAGEKTREQHHLIGMKDGRAEGCAHSDTELRAYINYGKVSNPNCPRIDKWTKENQPCQQTQTK